MRRRSPPRRSRRRSPPRRSRRRSPARRSRRKSPARRSRKKSRKKSPVRRSRRSRKKSPVRRSKRKSPPRRSYRKRSRMNPIDHLFKSPCDEIEDKNQCSKRNDCKFNEAFLMCVRRKPIIQDQLSVCGLESELIPGPQSRKSKSVK
jgi:hypothetical protein